jgi:hypothetical protein
MMNIESDVKEIREQVKEISRKLDIILQERETIGIMALSERSLYKFLDEEPDLYSVQDIKAVYK